MPPDHTHSALPKEGRYPELDALRGVAAFTVVVLHFHDLWQSRLPQYQGIEQKLIWKLAQPFYAGGAAVYLFFTLSGFVLALPILRKKKQSYTRYALRRIVRIYGPYLGAVALAVGLNSLFTHWAPLDVGQWGSGMWRKPPDGRSIASHLLLVGYFDTRRYDFVIWTLVQEMRLSLVFPLLFSCIVLLGDAALISATALVALFSAAMWSCAPESMRWNFLQTPLVAGFFAVGVIIAMHRDAIQIFWRRSSLTRKITPFIAVVLYGFRLTSLGLEPLLRKFHIHGTGTYVVQDLAYLLASSAAIVTAINSSAAKYLLRTGPAQFLGRISYSLYLIHPLLLLSLAYLLRGESLIVLFVLYTCTSILASWLFCLRVEEPMISLSRSLA